MPLTFLRVSLRIFQEITLKSHSDITLYIFRQINGKNNEILIVFIISDTICINNITDFMFS